MFLKKLSQLIALPSRIDTSIHFEIFKNSSMFAPAFSSTITGSQSTWDLVLGEEILSGRGDPNQRVETRKA